jgi:hypothetical protein
MSPWIIRKGAASQIGTVPAGCVGRLDEGSQPLVAGWVSAEIQVIEIERARKTFKLDLGGLGLGFSEVVQDPRTHERHDHPDDGDDNQHFDEGEAFFTAVLSASGSVSEIQTHFIPPSTY